MLLGTSQSHSFPICRMGMKSGPLEPVGGGNRAGGRTMPDAPGVGSGGRDLGGGGWEAGRGWGRSSTCPASDSSNSTSSIFPASPKAAQLCWLRANLPCRLLQGQCLAGCGLTPFLRPARFSPTMPLQVAPVNPLRAFIVCQGLFSMPPLY